MAPRGLSEDERLWLIERAIATGDSWMASRHLRAWGDALRTSLREKVQARTQAAGMGLDRLLAHEAVHGRFSLLNRQAPHIVRYEYAMRMSGKSSIYGPSSRSDAHAASLSVSSNASP